MHRFSTALVVALALGACDRKPLPKAGDLQGEVTALVPKVEEAAGLTDALGEFVDIERDRRAVARHLRSDLILECVVEAIEIEQCARVHSDHPVDDELEAREADARVRDACEVEGAIRIADVHHDLHG